MMRETSTQPDRAAQRAGHSPLPWQQDSRVSTRIAAADGRRGICSTGGYSDSRVPADLLDAENEANAELIVAAVNAHAGLLAQLQQAEEQRGELLRVLEGLTNEADYVDLNVLSNPRRNPNGYRLLRLVQAARRAIANAQAAT
jgi:hypothetical protein